MRDIYTPNEDEMDAFPADFHRGGFDRLGRKARRERTPPRDARKEHPVPMTPARAAKGLRVALADRGYLRSVDVVGRKLRVHLSREPLASESDVPRTWEGFPVEVRTTNQQGSLR